MLKCNFEKLSFVGTTDGIDSSEKQGGKKHFFTHSVDALWDSLNPKCRKTKHGTGLNREQTENDTWTSLWFQGPSDSSDTTEKPGQFLVLSV